MNQASIDKALQRFIASEQLPESFIDTAKTWYLPMLENLVDTIRLHHKSADSPFFLGINGAQGSGKSTLAALLLDLSQSMYGLNALSMSLDDFYLPKAARQTLGLTVHPLLATRGVPGTHDIALLQQSFDSLRAGQPCSIPTFDKALDDRAPPQDWQQVNTKLDLVILEGWCVGSPAQAQSDLGKDVNDLEQSQDARGIWRKYVNTQLQNHYQPLFQELDQLIMLKAPSFAQIFAWRLEQETKMQAKNIAAGKAAGGMSEGQIAQFIQHYQRITEHGLAVLPSMCERVFELNPQRRITACHPAL